MGQALLVAGALGLGAAGAYNALRSKEVRLAAEPRHAPGFLEAEQACMTQDPLHDVGDAGDSGDSATPAATSGSAHAVASAAPAPFDASTLLADTAVQEQQGILSQADAERQRSRAERLRIVEELRAMREDAERRRREFLLQERRELREQAWMEARQSYPRPAWLETRDCINVAVTGNAGVGKSSFINTVRNLRPRDAGAADVSPNETTMEPTSYDFSNLAVDARLWDLPGAGTRRFPRDGYVQSMGLRYFDIVIIVTASRYTETEIMIAEALRKFQVPYFMVRNKVDSDITNNDEDHGISADETIASIREDMRTQGVSEPYLISSKFANRERFDLPQLIHDACRAITVARDVPEDWLGLAPITIQADGLVEARGATALPAPPPPMAAVEAGLEDRVRANFDGHPERAQHVATDLRGGYVV